MNLMAVGSAGTIVRWNGTSWTPQSNGSVTQLQASWGSDASNLWGVGDGGAILKWSRRRRRMAPDLSLLELTDGTSGKSTA